MTKALTCPRCGIDHTISADAYQQRINRNVDNRDWCNDCRGFAPKHACRGWSGDVDENFMPMRHGKPYLPGLRTCGRVDCVNKEHIVGLPKVERVAGKGCSVEGCDRPHNALGKCMMHYRQDHRKFGARAVQSPVLSEALQYYTDTPTKNYCAVPLCGQKYRAKGLCYQHHRAVTAAVRRAEAKRLRNA